MTRLCRAYETAWSGISYGVQVSVLQATSSPSIEHDHKTRDPDAIPLISAIPFFGVHLVAIAGVIYFGWSWTGLLVALVSYTVRMFGVTAGYHRYFAHRSFKTNRVFQFFLAVLATSSTQKGVLWWAAHHRTHHRNSDQPGDIHSPVQRGFWWSHVGWILVRRYDQTDYEQIRDFAKYPELRFLNRFYWLVDIGLASALFFLGGTEALLWGFFVATVALWHGTFTINSLAHVWGKRRYATSDDSRNNFWLALITLGEGWHNNHHFYQRSTSQGFFWWEIDVTYYVLKVLSWTGLVHGVSRPPAHIRSRVAD